MQTRAGVLTATDDGRCALRFERRFDHPAEKVWRALTEPEHLRGWFAQYLDYDSSRLNLSREGNPLEFVPGPGAGQALPEEGRVTRSEPPVLLEYTWGEETLRWELSSDGDEGCRLTFINLFADPGFAPLNALGWHTGLDRLAALLDGGDPAHVLLETDETAATELQRQYERTFG